MTWKVSKDSVYPGVASARAKMSNCQLVQASCTQQSPPQQERLQIIGLRYGCVTLIMGASASFSWVCCVGKVARVQLVATTVEY